LPLIPHMRRLMTRLRRKENGHCNWSAAGRDLSATRPPSSTPHTSDLSLFVAAANEPPKQKAEVAEHPKVFDHVGLLIDGLPEHLGCPPVSSSDDLNRLAACKFTNCWPHTSSYRRYLEVQGDQERTGSVTTWPSCSFSDLTALHQSVTSATLLARLSPSESPPANHPRPRSPVADQRQTTPENDNWDRPNAAPVQRGNVRICHNRNRGVNLAQHRTRVRFP
jgi:hypothetical protein